MSLLTCSQGHRYITATHTVYSTQGATYPCRAILWHVITDGTCEFRRLVSVYFRRCCLSQLANELRGTVMPRLRRVADLCSSKLSDAANTRIHGRLSAVLRKKKSSAVLLFRSGRRSAGLRQAKKQRETGVKRVETAGVYPLARRRGCGEPPRQRLAPILYAQEAAKPQFTSCTDRDRVLK